jgi:hypothetical protein
MRVIPTFLPINAGVIRFVDQSIQADGDRLGRGLAVGLPINELWNETTTYTSDHDIPRLQDSRVLG